MQLPKQPHLSLYDYHHVRQAIPGNLPFFFFGSSSAGNSVYLKESQIMIDLGFSYHYYLKMAQNQQFWYHVWTVLLTDEHSDHLNPSTLMRLLKLYPHLTFIISQRMFNKITNPSFSNRFSNNPRRALKEQELLRSRYAARFVLLNADHYQITLTHPSSIKINAWFVSHQNVINVAYEITTTQHHILYSSDLDHVMPTNDEISKSLSLPVNLSKDGHLMRAKHPFDLMFLEANYDQKVIDQYLQKYPDNPHVRGNLRHISEQEAWEYVRWNMSYHGIFIPLHASTAFGTLVQNLK